MENTEITNAKTTKNKSSVSEKGHGKNISNGQLIINHALQLGAIYNPSNLKINISNLQNKLIITENKQQDINILIPPYSLAVDNRELLFAPKNKKISLLKKALKATENVTPAILKDFATLTRKFTGQRKKALNPKDENQNTNSVAQLSFDQRTNNYHQLAIFLQNIPNYIPNEIEYKTETLLAEKDQMLAATQQVNNTFIPLTAARAARNNEMYLNQDNFIDLFITARAYILSIVPSSSPIYKAVMKIKFSKIIN